MLLVSPLSVRLTFTVLCPPTFALEYASGVAVTVTPLSASRIPLIASTPLAVPALVVPS